MIPRCIGMILYLGSQPLDRLVWIRISRHTDGFLLSWEGRVSKHLPGLDTFFLERLEVLISKLDGILNRPQSRGLLVSRHSVSKCKLKISNCCLNNVKGAHPPHQTSEDPVRAPPWLCQDHRGMRSAGGRANSFDLH